MEAKENTKNEQENTEYRENETVICLRPLTMRCELIVLILIWHFNIISKQLSQDNGKLITSNRRVHVENYSRPMYIL